MKEEEALSLIRTYVPEPQATELCTWVIETRAKGYSPKEPVCPNCSMPGRPFYLRPIPRDFVQIEGARYECSKCGYKRRDEEI